MINKLQKSEASLAEECIQPFLQLDIFSWKGLVQIREETLYAAFGKAIRTENVELGYYPARLLRFDLNTPSRGFNAYVRYNSVILIETLRNPPDSVIKDIGDPPYIKPHEILRDGAYVHEYLYCKRGLVLSVAESFQDKNKLQIVRCRGIHPISSPDQFGAELYRAFEDMISWE